MQIMFLQATLQSKMMYRQSSGQLNLPAGPTYHLGVCFVFLLSMTAQTKHFLGLALPGLALTSTAPLTCNFLPDISDSVNCKLEML